MAKSFFNTDFWNSFGSLGIYSREDGDLLADQEDAPTSGGANPSDEKSDNSNEQNNDMNLDLGTNTDSSDMGDLDMGDDSAGGGDSSDGSTGDTGGDMSGDQGSVEETDPNKNPFKDKNIKSLLDSKLAEIQAAVNDTLQKIYAYPKVDTVVVSELENLLDSIRNIRETVYVTSTERTTYQYRLAVITYSSICEMLKDKLQAENK